MYLGIHQLKYDQICLEVFFGFHVVFLTVRVILKEDGSLTYFATDILYHINKINRKYDTLINIWGADHHGYIERIRSVISAHSKPVELVIILGQLVNLFKNGEPIKMSKRTGNLIELNEVIDEIGSDATRFFMIEKKPELPLDFDLDLAKQQSNENPVYYIQYAYARISTIISKCSELEHNKNAPFELNK